MADLKISQLSSATALAGTEVVPVVQSSATKKATIDQILAPASGKGIDFSAAGGDVLTMYDEGTFTPVWNGGTLTVTLSKYTRIGRQVTWIYDLTFGSTVVVAASTLTLPFASVDNWGAGSINYTDIGAALFVNLDGTSDTLQFRSAANAASIACSTAATKRVVGIVTYNA